MAVIPKSPRREIPRIRSMVSSDSPGTGLRDSSLARKDDIFAVGRSSAHLRKTFSVVSKIAPIAVQPNTESLPQSHFSVREYTGDDLDALRAMHAAQNYGYPFPDVSDP